MRRSEGNYQPLSLSSLFSRLRVRMDDSRVAETLDAMMNDIIVGQMADRIRKLGRLTIILKSITWRTWFGPQGAT